MKNTISHISRQERRKLERKVARMSPQELNKYGADQLGISEREFFKMTWCLSMEQNVATANAIVAYYRKYLPDFGTKALKRFASLGIPLPPYESLAGFQKELENSFVGCFSRLQVMIQEEYFSFMDLRNPRSNPTAARILCEIAGQLRPGNGQIIDYALFVTEKIEHLFPVMNGRKTVEDLWKNYVKTDPFTRLGIPA